MAPVSLLVVLPALSLAPVSLVTEEDTPTSTVIQADAGADPPSFSLRRTPRRGSVTLDEKTGALTFRPHKDAYGTDEIVVEVRAASARERITIPVTIHPVNDAPVVAPLRLATREDEPTGAILTAHDVDGDALRFALGTAPARGTATVDGKGRVVFTPAPDVHGTDRFVIVVDDGATKIEAPVDVAVMAVNDAPTVQSAALTGA